MENNTEKNVKPTIEELAEHVIANTCQAALCISPQTTKESMASAELRLVELIRAVVRDMKEELWEP